MGKHRGLAGGRGWCRLERFPLRTPWL
jgi:hypothetical protein